MLEIFINAGAVAWNQLQSAEKVPYEQMARRHSEKYHGLLVQYKVDSRVKNSN